MYIQQHRTGCAHLCRYNMIGTQYLQGMRPQSTPQIKLASHLLDRKTYHRKSMHVEEMRGDSRYTEGGLLAVLLPQGKHERTSKTAQAQKTPPANEPRNRNEPVVPNYVPLLLTFLRETRKKQKPEKTREKGREESLKARKLF